MNQINLDKILKDANANLPFIAQQLFPGNKYPLASLKRVMRGDALLDSEQLANLALLLNRPIESLYADVWKAEAIRGDASYISFNRGAYKVTLNLNNLLAQVYHEKTLEQELVLSSASVTLKEFFATIDKIIKK